MTLQFLFTAGKEKKVVQVRRSKIAQKSCHDHPGLRIEDVILYRL